MNKDVIFFEKLSDKYILQLREYRNSDFVKNNMIFDKHISTEDHLKWWEHQKVNNKSQFFLIFLNSQPCGLLSFTNIDLTIKKAEFGLFLFEEKYSNIGISLFAEYFSINYMFGNLDLNKIYLNVIDFNKKTISLHKNFGFSIEGISRDDILKNNQYCNLVQMSLLKKEWEIKKNSIDSFLKKINNFEINYQVK